MAIQVVAKANQYGFQLNPNHLFQCQTIADLAPLCDITEVEPAAAPPESSSATDMRSGSTEDRTPANFPLAKLSQRELDGMLKKIKQVNKEI
jgi:hypothetical protein